MATTQGDQVAAIDTDRPRTYGNWRRPLSPGLGNLGLVGTILVFAGVLVLIVFMTFRLLIPALIWTLTVGIVLLSLMVKNQHGQTGLQRVAARVGWRRTKRRGSHLYRSGPLGQARWGTFQLPGLLAPTTLTEAQDSYGRPFAILAMPQVQHYSVALECEPDGASLVNPQQIDSWVAQWGHWIASLSHEMGVVAAAVTVETAPDTGARLRRAVTGRMVDEAPALATQMLNQAMLTYPQGSAAVRAWVTLTFNGRTQSGKKRQPDDMTRDLASRLPGLTQTLGATGAGSARPVTAQDLCEIVRVAYDPAAASIIDEAHSQGQVPDLDWSDVGPTATEATWDTYRHDGAWSRTWAMTSAPRGEVFSSVLTRLLAPHGDIDRKRVTIVYRPLDSARAARTVEADKRNADFRVGNSKKPSARALAEQKATDATRAEEARGAGLVDFGMLVTATVLERDRLPDARVAIENLAATARILLRPAHGSQDSAFAAALPLGLVLREHSTVPTVVKDAL